MKITSPRTGHHRHYHGDKTQHKEAQHEENQHEEAMLNSTPDVGQMNELTEECQWTLRSLFEHEESNLLRYAFSLTGRRAVAEEIVQEVFLQLHAQWEQVSSPRAWLVRSVRNRAFHYLRKCRRETLGGDQDMLDAVTDDGQPPDELMIQLETVAQLRQLVGNLPDKDQRLVRMKYFEGLKYREISQRTGLTVSNVGFRLHQVLKKLADGLLPKGANNEKQ